MTSDFASGTHVSRYFAALRKERGLRPGQLAARLGSSNVSKHGSLIRAFELGEPLSDHWFQKLVAELQPDPTELRHCLELDQAEAVEKLERDRIAWDAWADEPIEPFLTIRYMPAVYGVREVPRAFCNRRVLAEDWAADELKRFGAKGFLSWTRRERTWYDLFGVKPRRAVTWSPSRNVAREPGCSWADRSESFCLGPPARQSRSTWTDSSLIK